MRMSLFINISFVHKLAVQKIKLANIVNGNGGNPSIALNTIRRNEKRLTYFLLENVCKKSEQNLTFFNKNEMAHYKKNLDMNCGSVYSLERLRSIKITLVLGTIFEVAASHVLLHIIYAMFLNYGIPMK